ncbi:orotidine-5'-phosphate decarboxylase [Tuwongella immobilis]|uniref:Orotidine 5'-phosphate decarboxylase n=1 Tax=Tuwongella immobilis TaxID=692036 RepID=A0A6C2YUW3_9BACT|nr:orotidine-5'-phosphate decarboxylase [Tuwongella immobilis]VIP04953.1 orotidine 5 -phosphate decarboxylase : Orotidine 5'-phosphate decarboxylase OS=Singulisphaera acidiphila (strain ATCC BAA-1392 / DSM 18658 / VKM B-2454 / MOB10) GN=pyrF PE=3 SV=1: OMPdecase [Tuwongella immobilis]VTS07264.1 orotidine 5 -phosphate decarboxylase : Orotidine 5'-phosphate decarboxylase OS=Singulisphaera acidiphila (strain ATCC BAA-1392 / DSM 18658 / VKM B-2454 / MOB10) GN=pyrF PE=3 SV=1: OMPdecase [Tuwongella imm
MTPLHFADRLSDAVRRCGNAICLGIDPRWESLPRQFRAIAGEPTLAQVADAFAAFSIRVLELARGKVPVVKPQAAFFEGCGPDGMRALQTVLRTATEMGYQTILDAKRGDIASTATAYADAAFAGTPIGGKPLPVWNADSLTVNPYLGRDAIEPFIQTARASQRGLFILVRTSNPGAGMFQDLDVDGVPLYRHVGEAVAKWADESLGSCGYGDLGAVVGATHPTELAELRRLLPRVWFLVPGYGSQGGAAADVAPAFDSQGLGAVINSSRGLTFPYKPDDPAWESAITQAIDRMIADLANR